MGKGSISRWRGNVREGFQGVRSINELQIGSLDNLNYDLKRSFMDADEETKRILREARRVAAAKKK